MIYVHSPKDLNQKSADLECVYLVREIKRKQAFPLTAERLEKDIIEFFVSESEKAVLEQTILLIPPTLEQLNSILSRESLVHEKENVARSIQILSELPLALKENLTYTESLLAWQQNIASLTALLNQVPYPMDELKKKDFNRTLSEVFRLLLRNEDFVFKSDDLINEARLAHITGLVKSFEEGYIFHVSLEEHIKKISFDIIKKRIPFADLQESNAIQSNIFAISKGVQKAFEINTRAVHLALTIYAYISWLLTVLPIRK